MSAQDDTEQAKRAALELTERDKQAAHIAALEKQLRETQAQLADEREQRERLYPKGDRGQGGITPPEPRTAESVKADAERYPEFATPSRHATRADELKAVNAASARDGMAKDQNQQSLQRLEPDEATRDHEARQREDRQRTERLAAAPREHDAPSIRLADLQREDNRAAHALIVEQQQKERENAKTAERDDTQAKPDPVARRRELTLNDRATIPVHRQSEQQQRQLEVTTAQAALERRREMQRVQPSSQRFTAPELTDRRQRLAQREAENAPLSKEQTEARASRAANSPEKAKQTERE